MVKRAAEHEHGGAARKNAGGKGLGRGLGSPGRGILGRWFSAGSSTPLPARHREGTSLAIASGKGGTGKSFLATSLAVLLHREDRRVAVVDCDFGLACDHLLFGVTPKSTLQHLLSGEARLGDVAIATPAGPTLIPGASGVMQMAGLDDRQLLALGRILGEVARSHDVVILDVGAGIAPQSMLTLLSADQVLMVTQPEIAALTDAYAIIKCGAQLRPTCRFSVVVNRVLDPGQGQHMFARLAQVAGRHAGVELSYLGEIPEDSTVSQRRSRQQPLVVMEPQTGPARALQAIARELAAIVTPLAQREIDSAQGIEARFREHRLFLV